MSCLLEWPLHGRTKKSQATTTKIIHATSKKIFRESAANKKVGHGREEEKTKEGLLRKTNAQICIGFVFFLSSGRKNWISSSFHLCNCALLWKHRWAATNAVLPVRPSQRRMTNNPTFLIDYFQACRNRRSQPTCVINVRTRNNRIGLEKWDISGLFRNEEEQSPLIGDKRLFFWETDFNKSGG